MARWRKSCCVKAGERVYLGYMQKVNPKPGKEDTPMRTNSVLVIEPAVRWQRLQQSKEFFFEDLDAEIALPYFVVSEER